MKTAIGAAAAALTVAVSSFLAVSAPRTMDKPTEPQPQMYAPTIPSTPPPTSMSVPKPTEKKPEVVAVCTEQELEMLAKTVWGEARGCSVEEQRLVVWTALQRVDSQEHDFAKQNCIADVLSAPHQFDGYKKDYPVTPEIYAVVEEEVKKWAMGEPPPTHEIFAPELPYYFFDGGYRDESGNLHNYFRKEWR